MGNDFKFVALNEKGREKCGLVEDVFERAFSDLVDICPNGREFSLVLTKLQEASYFAKKSISLDIENWSV